MESYNATWYEFLYPQTSSPLHDFLALLPHQGIALAFTFATVLLLGFLLNNELRRLTAPRGLDVTRLISSKGQPLKILVAEKERGCSLWIN